jgi:hypothetical protein
MGSKIDYQMFDPEFFVKNDPSIWRDSKFLVSSPFLPIFSAIDAQRGGLHLFFGHHKQFLQKRQETLA